MKQPVTYIIIAILLLIYFSSFNLASSDNEVLNYIIRSTYHANLSHLIVNLLSFYYLMPLERILGSERYLFAILFIWIVSSLLLYLYHRLVPSKKVLTVGFSAIIFGLVVVYYFALKMEKKKIAAGLFITIVLQLFIPRISIAGHICGIIAGLVYVQLFGDNKVF